MAPCTIAPSTMSPTSMAPCGSDNGSVSDDSRTSDHASVNGRHGGNKHKSED
ncbi:hypothetical protein TcasGA2_TC033170 [Tribolium castaneum]|uniref:Uncharacterized protein n=1 Tax=Tribolium castaneum TaxID=7070 RepID=A0A139WH74_TRICA|nr:hypothetical protein TcasGA2_TC033170 [Tribolium castaneum]